MLTLAAWALAAATPTSPPVLVATEPWWEKVTMTFSGDGQKSCRFETSLQPGSAEPCDSGGPAGKMEMKGDGDSGEYLKLTFERRFSPGSEPNTDSLEPGDTLLAHRVMLLSIDSGGSVKGCRIVAASGDVPPDYDCDQVRAETFKAGAGGEPKGTQQAFMTVLVYGHTEQLA